MVVPGRPRAESRTWPTMFWPRSTIQASPWRVIFLRSQFEQLAHRRAELRIQRKAVFLEDCIRPR